jgi:hypothetical protein
MKSIIPLLFLFLLSHVIHAQERQIIEKDKVIRIAKRHCAYWEFEDHKPSVQLNENTSEWLVQSTKHSYTKKGNCKYTNGCTKVKIVKLVIDATTGKVKSKVKEKTIYPNYE